MTTQQFWLSLGGGAFGGIIGRAVIAAWQDWREARSWERYSADVQALAARSFGTFRRPASRRPLTDEERAALVRQSPGVTCADCGANWFGDHRPGCQSRPDRVRATAYP